MVRQAGNDRMGFGGDIRRGHPAWRPSSGGHRGPPLQFRPSSGGHPRSHPSRAGSRPPLRSTCEPERPGTFTTHRTTGPGTSPGPPMSHGPDGVQCTDQGGSSWLQGSSLFSWQHPSSPAAAAAPPRPDRPPLRRPQRSARWRTSARSASRSTTSTSACRCRRARCGSTSGTRQAACSSSARMPSTMRRRWKLSGSSSAMPLTG